LDELPVIGDTEILLEILEDNTAGDVDEETLLLFESTEELLGFIIGIPPLIEFGITIDADFDILSPSDRLYVGLFDMGVLRMLFPKEDELTGDEDKVLLDKCPEWLIISGD
jgi:hypothetical protein